jgi:hypothetical protein
MLRGFVDQSASGKPPLYAKFVEIIRALEVPDDSAGKAAKGWSDEAIKTWEAEAPRACSEEKRSEKLFLDPGFLDLGVHGSTYGPEQGPGTRQLVEQRIRLLQVARVVPIRKPPVHRSNKSDRRPSPHLSADR